MAIIKIHDEKTNKEYYLEWSSIVDAPITYGLSLKEFKSYWKDEYGRRGMLELPFLLERVESFFTSERGGVTLNSYFKNNRAGKNESRLDKKGILDNYCRKRKKIK